MWSICWEMVILRKISQISGTPLLLYSDSPTGGIALSTGGWAVPSKTWCGWSARSASASWAARPRSWSTSECSEPSRRPTCWCVRWPRRGKEPSSSGTWWSPWPPRPCPASIQSGPKDQGTYRPCWGQGREDAGSAWSAPRWPGKHRISWLKTNWSNQVNQLKPFNSHKSLIPYPSSWQASSACSAS